MYGGDSPNDALAAKVAGHELRSLARIIDAGDVFSLNVAVPLMSIVNYRGFRLVAVSVLPISNKSTLIYGSSDAGVTVNAKDVSGSNNKFHKIFSQLNLASHFIGDPQVKQVEVVGPGDIEGHLGTDNNLYLIDFARVFPPEAPVVAAKFFSYRSGRSIFYKLLRPELTFSNYVPLSPDAFSGWSSFDDYRSEHNQDVKDATMRIERELIPKIVSEVLELTIVDGKRFTDFPFQMGHSHFNNNKYSSEKCGVDVNCLTQRLVHILNRIHFHGINIRYLGVIRSKLIEIYEKDGKTVDQGSFVLVSGEKKSGLSIHRTSSDVGLPPVGKRFYAATVECLYCIVIHGNVC